jgi:hypothetical protein
MVFARPIDSGMNRSRRIANRPDCTALEYASEHPDCVFPEAFVYHISETAALRFGSPKLRDLAISCGCGIDGTMLGRMYEWAIESASGASHTSTSMTAIGHWYGHW